MLWLPSISFFEILSSNLSCIMLTTTLSVNSSLSFSIPWIKKQFLLEYCSWSSLNFSSDSTLSFRSLTSYCKLFITFSLLLWFFSNSLNFSDISLTDCVTASCLLSLIFMDLVSLLRLYISDIFTSRVLRYSNTSVISLVLVTCWNTSSSAASLLVVVEILSLAFLLCSYGLDWSIRSLFLLMLLIFFCINVQCKFNQNITTLIST